MLIGVKCFQTWAGWAEAGVATAGTATEQLVGLGIPALTAGAGPQFLVSSHGARAACWGAAPLQLPEELHDRLQQLLDNRSCANASAGSANDGWGLRRKRPPRR